MKTPWSGSEIFEGRTALDFSNQSIILLHRMGFGGIQSKRPSIRSWPGQTARLVTGARRVEMAVLPGAQAEIRRSSASSAISPGTVPKVSPLSAGVWWVVGAFVVLEMAVSARYGFFRDELYFLIAGRDHLAPGYIDMPPLAPLLERASTALFGTSPSSLHVFPALAGGGVVVLAGVTARSLGGGSRAQVLASLAMACAPVLLTNAHDANSIVYDMLAWSIVIACVLTAIGLGRPKAWVGAGLALGLGLENNDLPVLLVGALAIGLLVTGRVRPLGNRWLLLGAALAVALWAPNLVWQATHGWPEVAMSRALRAEHSTGHDYSLVVVAELVYLGLAAVPLAVVGALRLWRDRSLRFLGIAAALVVIFVIADIPGRPYYTAGLIPAVFASGAVTLEQRTSPTVHWRRWLAAPAIGAVLSIVLVLPVLPEAVLAQLGGFHSINYNLAETIGWPQFADEVKAVYEKLPARQRMGTSVFTGNYGEAGALQLYWGSRSGLPPVLSGHNNYWNWGPGQASDATVLAVDSVAQLRPHFAACRYAATFRPPHNVDNDENGVQIWVCTGASGPWAGFWARLRHLG